LNRIVCCGRATPRRWPACIYLATAIGIRARQQRVTLDDGDQIVLHDDCPQGWQAGDRAALMIHGLAGSHESGYMQRIAHKLTSRGVRAFRMDLRGCGAGAGLAGCPIIADAARTPRRALAAIACLLPGSPTTLVGFSPRREYHAQAAGRTGVSAVRQSGQRPWRCVRRPIWPPARARSNGRATACTIVISWRSCSRQLTERSRVLPDAPMTAFGRHPRSLWEFDDQFTAKICGFGTADNY